MEPRVSPEQTWDRIHAEVFKHEASFRSDFSAGSVNFCQRMTKLSVLESVRCQPSTKALFVCLHAVGWTGDSVLCVYIICGIYWPALLICCSYFLILAFWWLKIVSMSCKIYSEVFVDTTHFYIYVKESGIMSLKLNFPLLPIYIK